MYIKLHKPQNRYGYDNAGSCANLVHYLEKENVEKDILAHSYFFSHTEDEVFPHRVTTHIDSNKRKLKQKEAKYFMLTINPSQAEIAHINNDADKLKAYTREVMNQYAAQFGREIDGRRITGNDLVYYAKIEQSRHYHPSEKLHQESYAFNEQVRAEITAMKRQGVDTADMHASYLRDEKGTVILPGNDKPGTQTHIHIIVSRKDKNQKLSLSPFSNSRGSKNKLNGKEVKIGFNRDDFVEKCEQQFDKQFQYERSKEQSYRYHYYRKHEAAKYLQELLYLPTSPMALARKIVMELLRENKDIQKMVRKGFSMRQRAKILQHTIHKVNRQLEAGLSPGAVAIKRMMEKSIKALQRTATGIEL